MKDNDPVYHVTCVSQQHDSQLSWGGARRIKTWLCVFKPPATQHKVCVWQMGYKLEDVQACTGSTVDWSCICEQCWICNSIPTHFKRQRVNILPLSPKCITTHIVSFQTHVIFMHETYCKKRCWAEYVFHTANDLYCKAQTNKIALCEEQIQI